MAIIKMRQQTSQMAILQAKAVNAQKRQEGLAQRASPYLTKP